VGARIGDAQVCFGVGVGPFGGVDLVLGVQQVKQAALANVELLTIGIARLFDRQGVAIQVDQLLGEFSGVIERNDRSLARIAACLVAQVAGLVQHTDLLPNARLIAAAVVQVPIHHDLGRGVVALVAHTFKVVPHAATQARFHAWLKR
jgi:hypothetical protein